MANNEGINKLSQALIKRMRQEAVPVPVTDFGSIGKNMHLTTDALQLSLAPDEYTVIESVGVLNPGDKVLVVWVSNEADVGEPVIVGKVI